MTDTSTVRESITDAMKFWEPLRLVYNGVLASIVAAYWIAGWPQSRAALTLNSFAFLFLLAVMANVAYCVAYLVDFFVQASAFRTMWRRFRWVLFLIGLAFAGILTRFFVLGFFAPPGP